jgi:hypothetical protein
MKREKWGMDEAKMSAAWQNLQAQWLVVARQYKDTCQCTEKQQQN